MYQLDCAGTVDTVRITPPVDDRHQTETFDWLPDDSKALESRPKTSEMVTRWTVTLGVLRD